MTELLGRYFSRLERLQPWHWEGHVLESLGQTIESAGPLASVGECCHVVDRCGGVHLAEVIGFRGAHVLSMPLETTEGIRFGDRVCALGIRPEIELGPGSWVGCSTRSENRSMAALLRTAPRVPFSMAGCARP